MATREEIREMLCDELRPELASAQRTDYVVEGLMNRLNDKGVVIRVDRELPDKNKNNTWYDDDLGEAGKVGWELGVVDMLKAGYVAVEPLIDKPVGGKW